MAGFIDAFRLHGPESWGQAFALFACLGVAFAAFRKVGGAATALLVTAGAAAAFIQIGHTSIPFAVAVTGVLLWRNRGLLEFQPGAARFAREYLLVFLGFGLYELGRFSVVSSRDDATANADQVVGMEKALGLFFEPRLQQWITETEWLTRALSTFYSHGFLAVVAGVVLWLYFRDPERYRTFRNALAVSTALALVLIALYPVAPPRLMPELGIQDTVVELGEIHAFANEFAAIPSLHVGWFALVGWILSRPQAGLRRSTTMLGPALGMQFVVIATGNHYWVDGVVGSAIAVGPAIALEAGLPRLKTAGAALSALVPATRQALEHASRRVSAAAGARGRARMSTLFLGGLFLYLGVAQLVDPGFTDFWGYLFFQVGATLVLLLAGELVFARRGGLSPVTHGIAIVVSFADVFGTDGNLYARIDEYDKFTHFMGTAAIAAGAYDILRAVGFPRRSFRPLADRLYLAMAIAITAGIGWEVYEYLGDKVFHTARTQGQWDTLNDVVSDALGAFSIGLLLWFQERASPPLPEEVRLPPNG